MSPGYKGHFFGGVRIQVIVAISRVLLLLVIALIHFNEQDQGDLCRSPEV